MKKIIIAAVLGMFVIGGIYISGVNKFKKETKDININNNNKIIERSPSLNAGNINEDNWSVTPKEFRKTK